MDWIKCSTELPPEGLMVLVKCKHVGITVGCYMGMHWQVCDEPLNNLHTDLLTSDWIEKWTRLPKGEA